MKRIGCLLQRLAVKRRWCATSVLVAVCCLGSFLLIPTQMASAETQGEAIVAAAASKAGVPYCEPGGSLSGPTACGGKPATFDCSGLAMYAVYQGTGGRVALPHGAGMDHVSGGVAVSRANLQPGDLVFFGPGFNGADFHHVGIYAGNGMMWDANTAFGIYGDGVQLRSLAAIENELGFDGAVRYWTGSAGGGIGEGSYVQVSGHGEVFKIVGGAPLYVSSWNAVGGPQPVTAISQQQFDSLRPYPADGTLVNTTNDGRVYVFAGGSPLYVSSWSALGGPKSTIPIDGWDVANPGNPAAHVREYPVDGTLINTTNDGRVYEIAGGAPLYVSSWSAIGGPRASVAVDGWDVANAGNPYAHLRPVPADGTLVSTPNDGRVYEIAGGAPLYVSNWSAIGGAKPATAIDGWDVANPGNPAAHLHEYPADGTLINTTDDGRVYVVAGGAPLYLSSWSSIGGPRPSVAVDGWDVANVGNPYAHLRPYPADGSFLNTSTGRVYRVAGGAPIAVSSWTVFGGVQPYTTVDQWDVDNESSPYAHLRSAPLDGTVVEGLPSHSYWLFSGGLRGSSSAASGAVAVDDVGLAAFPVSGSETASSGSAATSSRAPASRVAVAGRRGSKKRRACHKIANRRKQARCASAAKHRKAHGRARKQQESRTSSARPIIASGDALSVREPEMRLGSDLVRCPTPPTRSTAAASATCSRSR
ncbi:MAG: C40 family peptidase [Actinobacteria bacterium]|nr:C40 family peptidase [Actinomycetota bacterium]MBS1883279.1 C40 family peptidase [Actinomycetota bacterium]